MYYTDIDFAFNKFVETVHCIIDETIPCRKITVTESTPPHISHLWLSRCCGKETRL